MEVIRRDRRERLVPTDRGKTVCLLPGTILVNDVTSHFIGFSRQGLDSPGGDYMVVEGGGGDVGRLEEICRSTYRCIGEQL